MAESLDNALLPSEGACGLASLRASLRKLERTAVGKRLGLPSAKEIPSDFLAVFPAAWAIASVLGEETNTLAGSIVIARNEHECNASRVYQLIPSLLGSTKNWTIDSLVYEHEMSSGGRTPPALFSLPLPRHCNRHLRDCAAVEKAPTVLVVDDVDGRSESFLDDLTSPMLHAWRAAGTEIILLCDTAPSLALAAEAITKMGGEVGRFYFRDASSRDKTSSAERGAVFRTRTACARVIRLPIQGDKFQFIREQLACHFDIIGETQMLCEEDGLAGGMNEIGFSEARNPERFAELVLPLRHVFFGVSDSTSGKPAGQILCMDPQTRMMALYADAVHADDVPEGEGPSVSLLTKPGRDGILDRYWEALDLYSRFVQPTIETVYGAYRIAGERQLEVEDRFLDEEYPAGVEDALTPAHSSALEFVEASPPSLLEEKGDSTDEAQAEALSWQPEEPQSITTTHVEVHQPAKAEVVGAIQDVPPLAIPMPESQIAELLRLREWVRELKLQVALLQSQRDEARSALRTLRGAKLEANSEPTEVEQCEDSFEQTRGITTWDALFNWAHKAFENEIIFTSRARRAARKSDFRDFERAASAIDLLGKEYREVRTVGSSSVREAYEKRCEQLGFTVGPVGAAASNHRTADLYSATWEGKRYALDLHLQGSNSRDEALGLRIYFTWMSGRILIGHLPTHLRNSLS